LTAAQASISGFRGPGRDGGVLGGPPLGDGRAVHGVEVVDERENGATRTRKQSASG